MWPVEVRAAGPARGQSRTVASLTSRGDRLAFSASDTAPFPAGRALRPRPRPAELHQPPHHSRGKRSADHRGPKHPGGVKRPAMMERARHAVTGDDSFSPGGSPEPDCHLNDQATRPDRVSRSGIPPFPRVLPAITSAAKQQRAGRALTTGTVRVIFRRAPTGAL